MTTPADPLTTLEYETGPDPVATIVMLHGLGADGSDFAPFVDEIDLSAIGPVRWVFPNAPQIPVSINGGYVMPAWYDIAADRAREDAAGLRRSQAQIEALLAREAARGVPPARTVLAGFSQGCAMALLVGLRHGERLAGIAGLSGYLPLAADTERERSAANAATPVWLAHGRQDDVVPLARGVAARDALQALGYAVQWQDYPIPHSVSLPEIHDLRQWLQTVLTAPT